MKRSILLLSALSVGFSVVAYARPAAKKTKTKAPAAEQQEAPAPTPDPYAALATEIESTLDRNIGACDDFYQFACGGWLAHTELAADRVVYGRGFSVIQDHNQDILRTILEKTAAGEEAGADARMGTLYQTCMDTDAIEAAGIAALKADLARIQGAKSAAALFLLAADLPLANPFFDGFVEADFQHPDVKMFQVAQGGLGLPEREYYFPKDQAGKDLLAAYQAHVGKMLTLAGLDGARSAAIIKFETELARASRPAEQMRDITSMYHPTDRAALAKNKNVPMGALLDALGLNDVKVINVLTPDFFKALDTLLKKTSLDDLKAYMAWHQIHGAASFLPAAFDQESFAFFGTALSGQKQQKDRWKRCVDQVDRGLGDLLGQAFVTEAFGGDSKAKAKAMIVDIQAAFEAGLPGLAWMDDATRALALEKLHTIEEKIAYPDKWETYEGLSLGSDLYQDAVALASWHVRDELAKVGKPVDRTEWAMTAPTVNAYYNPLANEIVFPAGILQPPFFSADFPAAMNYGAIGMVVGHEVTHGFDDEGRHFAPDGALREWWDPGVAAKFEHEASCISDAYDAIEFNPQASPGEHLNGKLTLGENIADFGGIKLAAAAYEAYKAHGGTDPETVAGFTPEQLLFVGYAQSWCMLSTPEVERLRAKTDPHSPAKFRVNVPLSNLPAFWEAFGCEAGTPMHAEDACSVW